MSASQDESYALRNSFPVLAKLAQALLSLRGKAIIETTATLNGRAPAGNELRFLQVVQVGIDTTLAKTQRILGLLLNGPDQFIAVHLPAGQKIEQQQLRQTIEKTR